MLLPEYQLPIEISKSLENRKDMFQESKEKHLIGKPGYIAAEESIITDTIIALLMGKNILLKGPTGAGKTKLAETISAYFKQPMHSINCSVDLDAEGLLGFKTIIEGNIEFVAGPVVQAMEKGHLLYIDEINMAKPETLPILNGVLDYRRSVYNPFTSKTITGKAQFGVIAAINEGYIGTVPLNEALKNRFIVIEVPYIQGQTLHTIIKNQSQLKDEKKTKQFVQLSEDLVKQAKLGQVSEEAASIRALLDASDLATYLPMKRAIERAIVAKLDDEREKMAVVNIAETILE